MKNRFKAISLLAATVFVLSGCSDKLDIKLSNNSDESNIEESAIGEEDGNDQGGTGSTDGNDGAAEASDSASDAATDNTNDSESDSSSEIASGDVSIEGSDSDIETSLFYIWEYEGYIDECKEYTWRSEFVDCDYDGDGKTDRVNRSWDKDEQTAIYTIEFGNGDTLTTPKGWETGFPHIQGGDLDSDGINEIVVNLTYDTSTDPYSFGELWLFDKDKKSGEYKEVDLPFEKTENGGKGLQIDYDKPEDGKITYHIKGTDYSATEDVGEDYISFWWSDEAQSEVKACSKMLFCSASQKWNDHWI